MIRRSITAFFIALVSVPLLWLGGWHTALLASFIAWCSIFELLKTGKGKNWSIAVYLVTVIGAFFLMYWNYLIQILNGFTNIDEFIHLSSFRINVLVIIAFLIAMLTVETASHNFDINSCFYLFSSTLLICLSSQCIVSIREELGRSAIAYVIIATVTCDSGAHIIGSLFGKHQLAPIISPNKTIEGAIGGILISIICSVIVFLLFPFSYGTEIINKYGIYFTLIISLFLAFGAVIGDLVFSSIKRQSHLKDFGEIFPGHGGMLDRCDSLLFNLLVFLCMYTFLSNGAILLW